jgi:cytochrome c oxidase subunit 6b
MSSISLETCPSDIRFPNTNQAQHCWTRFNEFLVCQHNKGDDACQDKLRMYRSICPTEWVENWKEQIDSGTFPGVTFGEEEHH